MAWTTTPYCTLTEVKDALGMDPTSPTYNDDDAFLNECIQEAQQEIDDYVGYPFQTDGTQAAPATRVYSGNDSEQLFIDDCIQITQVTEKIPVVAANYGNYTVSAQTSDITADVVLGPDNASPGYILTRYSENPFTFGRQNYTIQGVFGYSSVPANVRRACKRLAVHYFKMRDTNYADTTAEQGLVRQKYSKQMPVDVVEILDKKRKRLFLAW